MDQRSHSTSILIIAPDGSSDDLAALRTQLPPDVSLEAAYIVRTTGNPAPLLAQLQPLRQVPITLALPAAPPALDTVSEREMRLALALAGSRAVPWGWDAADPGIDWTPEYRDLYGFPPEVDGSVEAWLERVHPADRDRIAGRMNQMFATPGDDYWDETFRIIHPLRGERWLTGVGLASRDAAGQITRFAGLNVDITEQKRTELDLRVSEQRLRTLIENLPGGAAFVIDAELRYVLAAGAAVTAAGMQPADFIGRTIYEALDPVTASRYAQRLQLALRGQAFTDEHEVNGRNFLTRGAPLWNGDGTLAGVLTVSYDITDRKQAEAELQRINEELEHRVARRTADLTAANAALTSEIAARAGVESQRTLLLQRLLTAQEDERQRIARELHDTLGQYLSLLNLRLSVAQKSPGISAAVDGELTLLRKLTNEIDQAVDRLTTELRPVALDGLGIPDAIRQYALEWQQQSGVAVDVIVTGLDGKRLAPTIEATAYRIVQEALTNVLKHAQATVVSVIVELLSTSLRVIIEDNGVGFEAGETEGGQSGGRQLGLIGMTERATLAGGNLMLESAPGAGTTIYLSLPLTSGRAPAQDGEGYEKHEHPDRG